MNTLINPFYSTRNHQSLLNIFIKMKPEYLKSLQLENHLTCRKLIDCKTSALGLLHIYLRNNPEYKVADLISDEKARNLFDVWRRMNHYCSVKTEKIKLCELPQNKQAGQKGNRRRQTGVSSVQDTKSVANAVEEDSSTAEKEPETV